jgi:hypothetical protein
MSASSTFASKVAAFVGKNDAAMDMALAHMAIDLERASKMQVPHDKGGLQNSGSVRRMGFLDHRVEFNRPYARRWEYETPRNGFKKGRKSRYLRDPGELISSKAKTYYREAAASIGA